MQRLSGLFFKRDARKFCCLVISVEIYYTNMPYFVYFLPKL